MRDVLSISQILEKIGSGSDLVTHDTVMRRIMSLSQNHQDVMDEFKETVMLDAAITARLMSAANDADGYGELVKNVTEAINKLGFAAARNIALTTPFIDNTQDEELYSILQLLWDRQLFNAVGARTFAVRLGLNDGVDYYALGLMLNLGITFLLYNFTNHYRRLLQVWVQTGGSLKTMEEAEFGISSDIVGQHFVRQRRLGLDIEQAIRWQNEATDAPEDIKPNIKLIKLTVMSTAFFFENRFTQGIKPVEEYALETFGIAAGELHEIMQRISIEADGATIRLAGKSQEGYRGVDLLRAVNAELGRATLSYDQMVRELESAMRKVENLAAKLQDTNAKLREASNHDPLTKIYNRRFFEEFLQWNFNRAQRYKTTLGCLMADIDHFKRINDTYGHLIGDQVLQTVASILLDNLRSSDVLARYGGEEFVVLLPETTPDAVQHTAARLNRAIAEHKFEIPLQSPLSVTISIGYVAFNVATEPNITSSRELIATADHRMYKAKSNGRNRIWP